MADLSVRLGPLELRNPVLSASGTYGHGLEMCHFTPPELVGALVSWHKERLFRRTLRHDPPPEDS